MSAPATGLRVVWAPGEEDDRALNTAHCPSIRAREDTLAGGSHICRPVKKIVYCFREVLRKPKPQVGSGEGGRPRADGSHAPHVPPWVFRSHPSAFGTAPSLSTLPRISEPSKCSDVHLRYRAYFIP